MINKKNAKRYCCEDISLIENYYEAVNDKNRSWHCHHRLETDLGLSERELIDSDRYYKVEAKYLIFLVGKEHLSLHRINKLHSDETKKKMSKSQKLRKRRKQNLSDEQRKIISERSRYYALHISEETRLKRSLGLKGKTRTEEQRKHISDGKKGCKAYNKGIPQIKYKWKTSTGEIIEMDINNVKRWHKDWILIE